MSRLSLPSVASTKRCKLMLLVAPRLTSCGVIVPLALSIIGLFDRTGSSVTLLLGDALIG